MMLGTQTKPIGSTVVKITFGRRVSSAPTAHTRRNPAQAMTYMDEDTLKVVNKVDNSLEWICKH